MKSLRLKLLLLSMPIVLALLAGVGYYGYLESTKLVTRTTQSNIEAIVAAKQEALTDHIESAEKIALAIAATESVQSWGELVNRNLSGRNKETVEQQARRAENLVYSLQESHWGRFSHIFLIDRSNQVAISPSHGAFAQGESSPLLGRDMSGNPWAMETMQKGRITISGFSIQQGSESSHLFVFAPVRDAANRVQAVIGIELPVAHLQQILLDGFDVGQSGRTYLTTEKGFPLAQKEVNNQLPLTGTALDQARLNGKWSGRRINTQGHDVFGAYQKPRDYPWVLVAEVKTVEVFADLHRLLIILAGGLGVTVVILLLLLLKFAKSTALPLRDLTAQLEKISLGEFNIEIPDSGRKDEIGNLTDALQRLVFSLQMVSKKLREAKALKTKIMKAKAMKKAS